jgi:hypothetical protein
MPLTPEQLAALDTLLNGEDAPLKGASPEDLAEGVKVKMPSAYTLVLNEGPSTS